MDWQEIVLAIERELNPHFQLDIWERGMYYYLLGHTRLRGIEYSTIPLSLISEDLKCSVWKAREVIRTLAEKGCIELDQTRKGHNVKVLLPNELSIPKKEGKAPVLDIEQIDFFKNREYLTQILVREQDSCFYCMKSINGETCELDHVISQLNGGGNSYRNIVAACHRCNTHKGGTIAEDYLRQLYRKNLLSESELEGRLSAIDALKNGELKPQI